MRRYLTVSKRAELFIHLPMRITLRGWDLSRLWKPSSLIKEGKAVTFTTKMMRLFNGGVKNIKKESTRQFANGQLANRKWLPCISRKEKQKELFPKGYVSFMTKTSECHVRHQDWSGEGEKMLHTLYYAGKCFQNSYTRFWNILYFTTQLQILDPMGRSNGIH